WPELIGQFVALAHAHGGRAAFYQVRPDALPLYLDAGLRLMKLGEEACIALHNFSLEGPQRTRLRYAVKRGERDGLTAEVAGSARDHDLLTSLREVSDAWLACRQAREKSFLGRCVRRRLFGCPISDAGASERAPGGVCNLHDDRSAYRGDCRC